MMSVARIVGIFALLASHGTGAAGDAAGYVADRCAGCHALERPDYQQLGIAARTERTAPLIYFAGNKYRREWLEQWLQAPERIRPAGVYPPDHIVTTTEGDRIDADTLEPHPALEREQAAAVADYLMTLRPYDERLDAVSYEPGNISWRLGQMNFGKFNNCIACHQDEPGYGGVSGPELYTAWERLQPEFIASYIADPVAWDPHTLMPGGELQPPAIHKLVDYLKAIAEEQP